MARTIDYDVTINGVPPVKVPWKTVAAITGACASVGAVVWVASRSSS